MSGLEIHNLMPKEPGGIFSASVVLSYCGFEVEAMEIPIAPVTIF